MAPSFYSGATLDDVMHWAFKQILEKGEEIRPTKGAAKELSGVLLQITNPLARISRTETKGKPFSCLGELCWYLASTKELSFIAYYLPAYRAYAEGQEIFGGYGPRLFDWNGLNQVSNVLDLLKRKPDSRQAVIQLFDAHDILEPHKDVPCTCTMQFMIRQERLHMLTYMRSNDALVGMPHDIFCFTMLQEIVARTLSVEVGQYKHMVGSLHIYEESMGNARQFLAEGWQPTATLMEPMPKGDPWPVIERVLSAEHAIRTGQPIDVEVLLCNLHPYWADLVRLLLVFRSYKDKDVEMIKELKGKMSTSAFTHFIDGRIERLR